LVSLPLGGHTFDGRAVDAVGNVDPTPASRDWSITADLDRDGFVLPGDCDDRNPAVHPRARDIPQNGVNEDCVRGDARFRRNPTRLRLGVALDGSRTRITLLRLEHVPRGARIRVTCRDRRHSCPLRSRRIGVRGKKRTVVLTRLFRTATLSAKTIVEVRITKAGMLGQLTRVRTRAGRSPDRTERCLDPRNSRRVRC
jgi:hypothetical protein